MAAVDPDPVANQQQLHTLFVEAMAVVKDELDVKTADGQPQFTDVCEWMAQKLGSDGERVAHQTHLAELLASCDAVAGVTAGGAGGTWQSSVPSPTDYQESDGKMLKRFPLRLWQLGGHEASHVKGAPQVHGVRDCMQKFLTGMGCETHKFPLEILFDWPTAWKPAGAPVAAVAPGSTIEPFSVGISIGSTVTMACHLLAFAAMKLDWLNSPTVLDHVKKDVAVRLMSCIYNWDMMDTFD